MWTFRHELTRESDCNQKIADIEMAKDDQLGFGPLLRGVAGFPAGERRRPETACS
jgi:hypothetical protein